MHDDMNIITVREKKVFIEGVPFNPKLIDRTRSSAPLTMICSLHKSETVDLMPGSSEAFIEKMLPEIFLPLPLLSVDRKPAFDYLLTSMKAVSAIVPYYRLYFRKDETFWDHITAMETSNGCHEQPVCPAQ
jgi:hypothetical protein